MLGYSETSLERSPLDRAADEEDFVAESAGVETTRILGDGWGFDTDEPIDTDEPVDARAQTLPDLPVAAEVPGVESPRRPTSPVALIGIVLFGFGLLSVMIALATTRTRESVDAGANLDR